MADLIDRDLTIHELEAFRESCIANLLRMSFDDITDVVKEIPSVNRWIPCSERLPEHYNDILFCERDRTIHKGHMYWDGTFIEHDVKFKKNDIVAWMPLPEPPEKE